LPHKIAHAQTSYNLTIASQSNARRNAHKIKVTLRPTTQGTHRRHKARPGKIKERAEAMGNAVAQPNKRGLWDSDNCLLPTKTTPPPPKTKTPARATRVGGRERKIKQKRIIQ